DLFEVMDAVSKARENALDGNPTLIEAKTFRMRGHEEASGTFYVPDEKFEEWAQKDPIDRFERWLMDEHILSDEEQLEQIQEEVDQSFLPELDRALEAEEPEFNRQKEESRLFAPVDLPQTPATNGSSSEKRFVDAIQFSLKKAFAED